MIRRTAAMTQPLADASLRRSNEQNPGPAQTPHSKGNVSAHSRY